MSNFGNFLLEHSSKAVPTQLVSLQKVFLLILTIFPPFSAFILDLALEISHTRLVLP